MAEILQFKPTITSASYDTSLKDENSIHEPSISTASETNTPQGYISSEDLYPVREQFNPMLIRADQLLGESIDLLNETIEMLINDDLISSDDALQRFQALLPELFCCRELGDGFGAIINSIFHAIGNMEDTPMNDTQLRAILRILRRINTEPFIEYDEAMEELMSLETIGFEVLPPHLKFVADLLNG